MSAPLTAALTVPEMLVLWDIAALMLVAGDATANASDADRRAGRRAVVPLRHETSTARARGKLDVVAAGASPSTVYVPSDALVADVTCTPWCRQEGTR